MLMKESDMKHMLHFWIQDYITTGGSGSVATSTTALDTFHNDIGAQTFDGDNLPYSNMPRKANPSDL